MISLKITKAVIPAAGLGTRMLPATKTIPKEMLPVADKPSIQLIIEEAVASGIEDILVVTNRAKSAMDDYFDYHPELEQHLTKFGKTAEIETVRGTADLANIFYVRQKETRGLGHAIWRAKRFVGDEPFVILLGDDIMKSAIPVTKQLIDVSEKYSAACVGVQSVSEEAIGKYCSLKVAHREGNVYNVSALIEKPSPEQVYSNFAILGRYVMTPAIFGILDELPSGYGGEIQLTDGINLLCSREPVLAVEFEGRRFDTGNLKGYLEAVLEYALDHSEAGPWLKGYIKKRAAEL